MLYLIRPCFATDREGGRENVGYRMLDPHQIEWCNHLVHRQFVPPVAV